MSDRHRDRDGHRDKSGHRDRDRDRDRERENDRDRKSHKERDRDRDSKRHGQSDRHKDSHAKRDDGVRQHKRDRSEDPAKGQGNGPANQEVPDEAEKKRQRLAKLAAWKNKKVEPPVQDSQVPHSGEAKHVEDRLRNGSDMPAERPAEASHTAAEPDAAPEQEAWLPWEDPTAVFTAGLPIGEMKEPPPGIPAPKPLLYEPHEGEDPLDAFMAAEVAPEVKAKEQEEAKRKEEARLEKAKLIAEGKIPKLEKIIEEESDEEETPDQEIQIPEHKVKLVVGPGGDKIKYIQRKSKCRLQIKKSQAELNKGFLEKTSYAVPKPRKPGDEVKMVTMMLFGNAKECDIATRMIDEAIENREQKQKQREREYERKREQKNRDRQMYHLRHTHDYETLGIPVGASKADARQAYRQLAKKYHPDKHPNNREEMKEKFQAIQKAFDSLMSTDEDARIEALGHR